MPDTASPTRKHSTRRTIRRILITLLILTLLAGIALGGIGFYFSNAILDVIHYLPTYTLAVTNVTATTVTLQRTSETQAPGTFQIQWATGDAIVGPIISSTSNTVTRQLLQTTAPLTAGTLTYWTRRVYSGTLKDSAGVTINDVQVPDSLGPMPAWFVPGRLTTWALMVHGRGVTREENLRVFKPLSQLGFPILAVSYRNDIGSPPSPDGKNHLGDSEWQDVEAGARYAIAHGAQHFVIYGWSQGGAVVEEFMHHSSYARYIQAIVLDAPALNWRAILTYQAKLRSLPAFIASIAELVVTIRSGVNFDNLDQSIQSQPNIPILLFHGTDDTTIPVQISDDFAHAHPDLVTYYRVPHTEHTEAWNTDPVAYDRELTAFLTQKLHLS